MIGEISSSILDFHTLFPLLIFLVLAIIKSYTKKIFLLKSDSISMWYFAKALQTIGLAQVLIGVFVGISQDNLATEYKIAAIGIAFFLIGRLVEQRFTKG